MFDSLTPAGRRDIIQKAEVRLRDHNLEAFLAFGDGDEAAVRPRPPTPAVQDSDAVWVVRGVLTPNECASIRKSVDLIAESDGWCTDRHDFFPTTDLLLSSAPALEPRLRELIFARIMRPLSEFYCGEAFLPEHLELREAFFVKYDATQQPGLPMHKDGSLFSFNILLSDPLTDFDGGGTMFKNTDWTVRAMQGDAVVHGGDVFHSGCPIARGERYLLVGFIQVRRALPYCVAEVKEAAEDAFAKFGHAAWDRSKSMLTPVRLGPTSSEVHCVARKANPAPSSEVTIQADARRRLAATLLQAALRGKAGRAAADAAADEAMLTEAAEVVKKIEKARVNAAMEVAVARSSLFAEPMSLPEAARLLLTSAFLPGNKRWETHVEPLKELSASEYEQPASNPLRLPDANLLAAHDMFLLPGEVARADGITRPDPLATSSVSTCVHRFRLAERLCARLLPSLRTAVLHQRQQDPEGVDVSNVGGWHSQEVAFEPTTAEASPCWYAELLPMLDVAVARLEKLSHPSSCRSACEPAQTITGWLNSSGPTAFNALHDHGEDVEWSLVLFIASGEAECASDDVEGRMGGSLLLKTPHSFLPIAPAAGELWAFPGWLPHCVMPRVLSPPAMPPGGDEERQRISAAFNVYSTASTDALAFVKDNMASVLAGRDRAAHVMQNLSASVPPSLSHFAPRAPSSSLASPPSSPPSPPPSALPASVARDDDVDLLQRELSALTMADTMAESDLKFVQRLLALDSFAAAVLLLRSGPGVDGEYEDLYAGAHFAPAEPIITTVSTSSSSFERVQRVLLRDNAPGNGPCRPKTSTIHQFVLCEQQASVLNKQLRRDAIEQSSCSAGVQVSNVGGFHSATATLDPLHDGAWYAPLAALLIEALHTVHADGHVAGCQIDSLDMRGWLNVSTPTCFNRPHDHGAIAYSAVYFVDDGGPPASPLPSGWSCGCDPASGHPFYYHRGQQLSQWEVPGGDSPRLARCAGELLFQTQHAAWTNQYAIFSVAPVPGTLWVFPSYMPHCTLPRTLRANELVPKNAELPAGTTQPGPSLRISIACNIATVACDAPDLPTVWQASRMC